jgi:hypothetical protein
LMMSSRLFHSRAQTVPGSDIYGRPRTPATLLAKDLAGSEAAFAEKMMRPYGRRCAQLLPISRRSTTIGCHSSPDPRQPFFNLIICRARLSPSPG